MREPSNTVVLFGSAARGDNNETSDVDILVLKDSGYPQSIKKENIEIQVHTKSTMLQKAINGDLFALHIAMDGVVLSDPNNFFISFKEACRLKEDYREERREAFILGGYILSSWSDFKRVSFLNKRIAWCVRTILISLAVEERRLIFSPLGLQEYAKPFDVEGLLNLRRSETVPDKLLPKFREFLNCYGGSEYLGLSRDNYKKLILGLGSSVAKSTYKNALYSSDIVSY